MAFLLVSISTIYLLLLSVVQGFVLSILWGWFIVDKFNIQSLSLWDAAGLIIVARTIINFEGNSKTFENSDSLSFKEILWLSFIPIFSSLFTLMFGFIIHTFFI